MAREVTHTYVDPLDHLWIETARRIGLKVVRANDAYAASDGRGVLTIASARHLDKDDCLAQMIFHELCHSLVEGEDSFARADWGLDNTGPRDLVREHACLRVQAHLAARHGLRTVLAPTTEHRSFYDALPPHPLEPGLEPSSVAARLALRRAGHPPWGPHLERALGATATIARATAETSPASRAASLWSEVAAPAGVHPTGPHRSRDAAHRCGTCAWRDASGRCQQSGAVVIESWPACERWESAFDCQECGACCGAAYHSVTVQEGDPVVDRHPELVIRRDGYLELARRGDRCAALEGGSAADDPFACAIYADRPQCCRDFERGGPHCLTARRRVGLSL